MKNLRLSLLWAGIVFVVCALGYQLVVESWGNQSLGNNDAIARFTSLAQPLLFGVGSFLLGFALFNAVPAVKGHWAMKTGLILGCLALLIMTKGFSFLFVRGAFERSMASRDQVAEKSAEVTAWEATTASLAQELKAAEEVSPVMRDQQRAISELREEIARVTEQAQRMDTDGNKANDREIPAMLARVESKKADLPNLEATYAKIRQEHAEVLAAIRGRIDTHRAGQPAILAGVATAAKSVHQFDRWADVLAAQGIETDHAKAVNLVMCGMGLGLILLEYIGLALISIAVRIPIPQVQAVAVPAAVLAGHAKKAEQADVDAIFNHLFGDWNLNQLRDGARAAKRQLGSEKIPHGTSEIVHMTKADVTQKLYKDRMIPTIPFPTAAAVAELAA